MFKFKSITLGEYNEKKLLHILSDCGNFVLFQFLSGNVIIRADLAKSINCPEDLDKFLSSFIASIENTRLDYSSCCTIYKDMDESVYQYARAIDKFHNNILENFTEEISDIDQILNAALVKSLGNPIVILNLFLFIDSIRIKPILNNLI